MPVWRAPESAASVNSLWLHVTVHLLHGVQDLDPQARALPLLML